MHIDSWGNTLLYELPLFAEMYHTGPYAVNKILVKIKG
jgi:hypothetical protein